MKILLSLLAGLLVLLAGLPDAQAQAEPKANTKDVMKFKLHYAQGVLEGITTENFSLIATNAQKLNRLSHAGGWEYRATEDYQRFTADFRRHTESLLKAAEKKNPDAATVAYFQLTVSCVNCHRYLRGTTAASTPTAPSPKVVVDASAQ